MSYVPVALRQLDETAIAPLTPEGRVTVIILQSNISEWQLERQPLVNIGTDPSNPFKDMNFL